MVEYEDDFGQHKLSEDLTFNVGSQNGSSIPLIVGAAIVLVVAVLYLKKKGKL